MKAIAHNSPIRPCAVLCALFLLAPSLWAAGWKDKIETVTAEGGEIWQNDYDVTARKTGKYNFIVYAQDHAGNEAVSGPFNVRVDPRAGLPVARLVYPENGAVIRQNINLLGVASGRFGVERVTVRIDGGEHIEAIGTEYWNKIIDFSEIPEGRHTIYSQAFDSKGASGGESSITFVLDKGPPVLELTSHKIGDLITSNTAIRGLARDPNGIARLSWSEDGKEYRPLSSIRRGASAEEFSIPFKSKNMEDGPLLFFIRAEDTTGLEITKPCLFFVDIEGPDLQIFSPAEGEDVFGKFFLSGRVDDIVGLERLYYEWGKIRGDIDTRPGDPFWSVELESGPKSAKSIKVVAVDKSGNVRTITRKLEDRRKVKAPAIIIDYPPKETLKALPADASIYGHIAPGYYPEAVTVTGRGEVPAQPSFRISPDMIAQRRSTLKLQARAADQTKSAVFSLSVNKPSSAVAHAQSAINITSPEKYSWISGSTVLLQGSSSVQGAQVEYRLDPADTWHPLTLDENGAFSADITINHFPEGPIHMELRTARGGAGDFPLYHPINHVGSAPEITFYSPTVDKGTINGNVTVLGSVSSSVPVRDVSFSLDGEDFESLPFISRYGKAWFSYFCDFTILAVMRNQLIIRVTDASGTSYDRSPDYLFDQNIDNPVIIVNTPDDGETITAAFEISGVAFDDDEVGAVYWRLLGPKPESIPPGPAGTEARAAAAAFAAQPNLPFQKIETRQSFQIPVDFPVILDGEYVIEIYAEDVYGVKSDVAQRAIRVSSSPPETRIMEPVITRYNRKAIKMTGFSSDANGIAGVSLSMDNGNTFQRAVLGENGRWELSLNTVAYIDGIYSALIRTEDNYGVTSFSNAMVNIDNTAPDLNLSSPENGQHIGTELSLIGRVADNIALKSLSFQIISAVNPNYQRNFDLPPQMVVFETMSLAGFPQGEYIIRIAAKDLADNESIVSRKIIYDADDAAAQIAIFNPLPGEIHSGPVDIVGSVSGSFLPSQVTLMLNDQASTLVDVDRYGVFHYSVPGEQLAASSIMTFSAVYSSETGKTISSPSHTMHYAPNGPTLVIDSHQDGDVITRRPWLTGRAWISSYAGVDGMPALTRQQRAQLEVKQILISYDNGRSFKTAKGREEWKFRLETGDLPPGPQPVLVKAQFVNGEEAVRRLLLVVDTELPLVETITPPENSIHRDNLLVYGTASDNFELADVDISLRPYDKFFYSVPPPIRGLYIDLKGLGATYFDVGLGLSLFKDNVRFQFQYGLTPPDGVYDAIEEGGRFVGNVFGIKLLANIFYLPFDFLFGPDWAFYAMNIAVGANFSYFTMDERRNDLFMGAIVIQWDIANINMTFFYPKWRYFRHFALYVEPEFWFASSDVNAEVIPRITIGLRWNFF
jgi:hypothetical protein